MGALLGILCGLAVAAPFVIALCRATPGLGLGVASVAVSFLLAQGALLAAHYVAPSEIVPFGTLMVFAFLVAVIAAIVRRELR